MIPRPVDSRRVRVVRAGGAAAVATLTAAAAHTLGGGSAPGPWLVPTVLLLAWPIALVIVGSRPSAVRTGLAAAAAQALLHSAFALVGDVQPTAAATGHHHAALALGAAAGGTVSVDGAMIAGHALAAVVTAAAVCHGERMLRAVARGIHSLLRLVVAPPTGGWPAPALPLTTPRGLRPRLAHADLSRRGPPR